MLRVGNILGSPRAETDDLLVGAFVETNEFRAIAETSDYNFVVGRRGTGKSAMYRMLVSHMTSPRKGKDHLVSDKPNEESVLALRAILTALQADYPSSRAVCRAAWKTHLLMSCLGEILAHYKLERASSSTFLKQYALEHASILELQGMERCQTIVARAADVSRSILDLPRLISVEFKTERLAECVRDAVAETKQRFVVMYDGLDEGWEPSPVSTAIIGGLGAASADLADKATGIYVVLFIRDNIFRAIAQLDSDYSRHIEGHVLRLHWDENTLLPLVAKRLRSVFGYDIEGDIKVWNRFAQRGLQGHAGFRRCLGNTLYRPRDVLVLLNAAYGVATRAQRESIIDEDVEAAAKRVSQDRLEDLLKEYDRVLPGLRPFVSVFHGRPALATVGEVSRLLQDAMTQPGNSAAGVGEFALFSTGRQILTVLHSVGFIGLRDRGTGGYSFCHDGANSDLGAAEDDGMTAIHPCYWKALDTAGEGLAPDDVVVQVHDDYSEESRDPAPLIDMRLRQLGQIVSQLPAIPTGELGAGAFSDWSYRAIRILFSGGLSSIQLQPRDDMPDCGPAVVAAIEGKGRVWQYLARTFEVQSCCFLVANSVELLPGHVTCAEQPRWGRFLFVVLNSRAEGVSETERKIVRAAWSGSNRLIVTVPAVLLSRCLSKLRNPTRVIDYPESQLEKRIETFLKILGEAARHVQRPGRRRE